MEDIIKTILDVVRVQHSATEGTDEKPFDMDDIVDMAMGVIGRPDEPEETVSMTESIQSMVESLAPDLFPPKTFEQMDDEEKTASVTNMLEERLRNGFLGHTGSGQDKDTAASDSVLDSVTMPEINQSNAAVEAGQVDDVNPADYSQDMAEYTSMIANALPEDMSGNLNPQETAELNDLIYKNLMEMMGAQPPRVEYPFDRSQIRYGKEKTITEQLMEEQQAQSESQIKPEQILKNVQSFAASRSDMQQDEAVRPANKPRLSAADLAQSLIQSEEPSAVSAWDLAQKAIDRDEETHKKEPYVPKPVELPKTKSASQLAAEAIARAQEEDKMKLEIEKQAEALMAEAAKRGQDPMKFALHQQEILQYMEKNSDELVSFEDYEDLSPEEKLEVERQIYIEKQIADGVDPDQVDTEVPEEYIPSEFRNPAGETGSDLPEAGGSDEGTETAPGSSAQQSAAPPMTEEMLRMISREVVNENAEMILEENPDEDIESMQESIFENLRKMMSQTGEPVQQEDIGDLIEQAIAANRDNQMHGPDETEQTDEEKAYDVEEDTKEAPVTLSAVELARAAQKAAKAEPREERETKSAVEIAREAQEKAKAEKEKLNQAQSEDMEETDSLEAVLQSLEDDFSDIGDLADEDIDESVQEGTDSENLDSTSEESDENEPDSASEEAGESGSDPASEGTDEDEADSISGDSEESDPHSVTGDMSDTDDSVVTEDDEEDEFDYVDPDELVLGEHTQAEVDEALENLGTLGLEGEVYERAKRMLLLELAGSEAELDAWLKEQENSKKKKTVTLNEDSIDDISDLDQDELEKELELALDEDFLEEEFEEDSDADEDSVESDDEALADEEDLSEEDDRNEGEMTDVSDKDIVDVDSSETESEIIEILEDDIEDAEEVQEACKTKDVEADDMDSENADSDSTAYSSDSKDSKRAGVFGKGSRDHKRKVFRKREKPAAKNSVNRFENLDGKEAESKSYQVSTRKPFILKNSASFMDQFEDFITDTQENRRLSTGFKKLDAMLRYGLHKGSYFIDAQPQYLKNGFMQQIADRAAESGIDVLYISTELSRYDLMVETVSRLSYEIHQGDPDKAVSAMAIMTGEDGADLTSLKDELNWYRGRISEHLFILDQEAVAEYAESADEASAGDILTDIISSIVREGAHKPAVFIDNIENILSAEDSEDMKPLIRGISSLARELGIPVLMSYGYAQAESEEELYPEEKEFHESIGNMCDVYMELEYADMITEDSVPLTPEDIRDMVEEGESLLINILLHKNRRPMKASLQIQGTPKYNYFEE